MNNGSKGTGNIGIGKAIEYFTSKRYTVSIPLNDSQPYDLVVEFSDGLKKVDVKYVNYKNQNGKYKLTLSSNRRSHIEKFDSSKVDFLFIVTGGGINYLIPSSKIKGKRCLNLGGDASSFIVR
jgi:hypothetical protein